MSTMDANNPYYWVGYFRATLRIIERDTGSLLAADALAAFADSPYSDDPPPNVLSFPGHSVKAPA